MNYKIQSLYEKFIDLFENDTMNDNKDALIKSIVENLEQRNKFKLEFKHFKYTASLTLKYKDNKL